MSTLVIGAGLSGLCCAKALVAGGSNDITVIDGADHVGGRVSTIEEKGFLLDRGFQVLLDSYPAVVRHIDIDALEPCAFDSGALLATPGEPPKKVSNPLLGGSIRDLFALPLGWKERICLATMAAGILGSSEERLSLARAGISTYDYLRSRGASEKTIDLLFRPFFAGVLLDDDLGADAALFRYYLRRFATGQALLPRRGMQAVPEQLASHLPADALRLGEKVERLLIEGDGGQARCHGAILTSGEELRADAVVLATDAHAACTLLGEKPPAFRETTALYFRSKTSLYSEPMLVLPTVRKPLVRHFAQLTNINPELAPDGEHLVSASILNPTGKTTQKELFETAQAEIASIFPAAANLVSLKAIRVPQAVPDQKPGFWDRWHATLRSLPQGLLLAGDYLHQASIQGAMESGTKAGQAILAGGKA